MFTHPIDLVRNVNVAFQNLKLNLFLHLHNQPSFHSNDKNMPQPPIDKYQNTELKIELDKEDHREFVTRMASLKCRIPNIDALYILNMDYKCASLAQFLLHCMPHSLKILCIFSSPSSPFWCDPLCFELAEAVKAVTDIVCLRESAMSGSTLEAFFKAASQARRLRLYYCKIDSSGKLDLDGPEYKWVVSTMWMMHY